MFTERIVSACACSILSLRTAAARSTFSALTIAEQTATWSAPAAMTSDMLRSEIPPKATSGTSIFSRVPRILSTPRGEATVSFVVVG